MRKALFILLGSVCVSLPLAFPASAQTYDNRLERLERDLMLMQKDIYRNNAAAASGQAAPSAPMQPAEIARIEVRFTQFDERLRAMEGRLEELEFENRKLRESMDRFKQDVELRFQQSQPAPALLNGDTPAANMPAATASSVDPQTLRLPNLSPTQGGGTFESARDQYNHAFRLLNQTQYDEAGRLFEDFATRYPTDPLIGNAFYWAGETYYVRQNYVQAADNFRRGFEALPNGPKAGDNLLKLAMSLNSLERNTEACVVLKQVVAKFGTDSTTLRNKAELERNRIGCK